MYAREEVALKINLPESRVQVGCPGPWDPEQREEGEVTEEETKSYRVLLIPDPDYFTGFLSLHTYPFSFHEHCPSPSFNVPTKNTLWSLYLEDTFPTP